MFLILRTGGGTRAAISLLLLLFAALFSVLIHRGIRFWKRQGIFRSELQMLGSAVQCHAVVTQSDARGRKENGKTMFLHRFVLQYVDMAGAERLIYFGLLAETPIPCGSGTPMEIREFPRPLAEISDEQIHTVSNPVGKIPPQITVSSYRGIPLDESATVMRNSDFCRYQAEMQREFYRCRRIGLLMALISGILAVGCLIFSAVTFFS